MPVQTLDAPKVTSPKFLTFLSLTFSRQKETSFGASITFLRNDKRSESTAKSLIQASCDEILLKHSAMKWLWRRFQMALEALCEAARCALMYHGMGFETGGERWSGHALHQSGKHPLLHFKHDFTPCSWFAKHIPCAKRGLWDEIILLTITTLNHFIALHPSKRSRTSSRSLIPCRFR